ncbi:hypothetical protein PENTCL1PPCAC_24555 [Pristionchus entomophagus]|uniref:BTB domain-containing protein n=1 Tax=Pristionchus entomophagus TaxID=358040 RepID=A0AAV5U667_9BILA|nr:hypothetical protein PENTCL1PPCAC_24555 [Pristionchus entomophagus]
MSQSKEMEFNFGVRTIAFESKPTWEELLSPDEVFIIDDKVVIEVIVEIIDSKLNYEIDTTPIIDPSMFASPNESGNVTLVIGDKKLRVSKDILAVHSSVFAAMFFGDFAEKGKEEIKLKDVVYEEFLYLLHVIYLGTTEIPANSLVGQTDKRVVQNRASEPR